MQRSLNQAIFSLLSRAAPPVTRGPHPFSSLTFAWQTPATLSCPFQNWSWLKAQNVQDVTCPERCGLCSSARELLTRALQCVFSNGSPSHLLRKTNRVWNISVEGITNDLLENWKESLCLRFSVVCVWRQEMKERQNGSFPFDSVPLLYHPVPTLLLPISLPLAVVLKAVRK